MRSAATPRPSAPEDDLLTDARRTAMQRLGTNSALQPRWNVGEAIHRPQSTLFPMRLVSGDTTLLRAYYKVHRIEEAATQQHAETNADIKMASIRRVLSHGAEMAERFEQQAGQRPVAVAPILALDLDRLTEVQVVLPGRALNRMALHRVPGRSGRARRAYRLLGQALAVIESLDPPVPATPRSMINQKALTRLERRLSAPQYTRLVDTLQELEDEVVQSCPRVCAHGDLSSAHILWSGHGVGLIDLLWASRWRGQDLADQANRLHAEIPDLPGWTDELVREMAYGYGDPDLVSSPQWRLSQLSSLTKAAASSGTSQVARYRRHRAFKRLSELLAG